MHLMLDLETGGVSPGCAIFSIGACLFSPYNQELPVHTYYEEISHSSCMEIGLRFERSTMNWWTTQPGIIPNGVKPLRQVLEEFVLWLSNAPGLCKEQITAQWANSPSFDLTIIKYTIAQFNLNWPYPFWQEMDVRTTKALAFPNGDYKLNNAHNALQDAINQCQLVQNAYLTLGLSNETRPRSQLPGNPRLV